MDEGGELGVGGEAQGDELLDGELVDVGAIFGGQERGEAEAFFEADDAVLNVEGVARGLRPAMTKQTTDMTIHQRMRIGARASGGW